MSTTHENSNAPPVPHTLGQLLDRYDHNFPTLSAQLGDKVRTRKQKTNAGTAAQRVPDLNGWLNAEKLIKAANEVFERNNVKLEKMDITNTAIVPAASSSPQGPCIQQCNCTLHVSEDAILAAADEIKKRRQQATRSNASLKLPAKILTDDRARAAAASSKYAILNTSTISSLEELQPRQEAAAAASASTVPVYATVTAPAGRANFDPIPASMPTVLPGGNGTHAEKIVRMFEREFVAGGARYPPLLEWTAADRSAAGFKDTGTFKKRCQQYLGARYGCNVAPEENSSMNLGDLEKAGKDYTSAERAQRNQVTQSYWHDKCRELYSSKQPST